jgi:8-oxo-dGTP pyrophosphatase MutT (NUDIX family)
MKYPVSIKAVLLIDGKVPLLKNERDEWELPGGKLDPDEQPMACVIRETKEELGIDISVELILDSWMYRINDTIDVLIVTYGCHTASHIQDVIYSHEHKALGFFSPQEIDGLNMPQGYKNSIRNLIIQQTTF